MTDTPATPPHSLHIKTAAFEFNAQGTEQSVNAQYEKFLQFLSATPTITAKAKEEEKGGGLPPNAWKDVPKDAIERVYKEDGEIVSLRLLPKGDKRDADAILMILFGFAMLKQKNMVPAPDVLMAARKSGVTETRIDRIAHMYRDFIDKGGMRRWSRYGLTNPGTERAFDLFKAMVT